MNFVKILKMLWKKRFDTPTTHFIISGSFAKFYCNFILPQEKTELDI